MPADIDSFVPTVGEQVPGGCRKEFDGRRFEMRGYLTRSSSTSIDRGRVPLTLCAKIDARGECAGRGARVLVTSPGDIADPQSAALRIHTKNGDATAKDVLDVVVEVGTTLDVTKQAVTACELVLVSATKT